MPVNPRFTDMSTAPYPRESAAKGDDQIAYENAVSCEEVGRHKSALEWYAEVKLTGNHWDRATSMSRVAPRGLESRGGGGEPRYEGGHAD
jgi:hypothetical protein